MKIVATKDFAFFLRHTWQENVEEIYCPTCKGNAIQYAFDMDEELSETQRIQRKERLERPCLTCGSDYVRNEATRTWTTRQDLCCKCKSRDCSERYSCGYTTGKYYCDECWAASPYRKDPEDRIDWLDAGEYETEEDY